MKKLNQNKLYYKICHSTIWPVLVFTMFFMSCSFPAVSRNPYKISITNWNVQTFFDGNNDGIEYSDFRKAGDRWNESYYEERLERLCDIIRKIDSDIFVMEELENEKIIYDISNYLSNNLWYKNKVYGYAAFAKEENSSIGCGVISKYPIEGVKNHKLDVRTESEKAPDMRSIMEVSLSAGDKKVLIFVNHWKSKSGGEEKSEKWRKWQESVLGREWADERKYYDVIVATGDFNRDISEFSRSDDGAVVFNTIGGERGMLVNSPWDDCENENTGSYFYKGNWERIDHFFSVDKNSIADFYVETDYGITKEDGTPYRYELFNHQGYSDHLPVTCVLSLRNMISSP